MKFIQESNQNYITVVCCQHGDETFGLEVFRYYEKRIATKKGLRLIMANEQAYENGTRFIDSDLNRVFPGKPSGNYEERLAHSLMPLITDAAIVLDIHTTTSKLLMTPIVTSLNDGVRNVINATTSKEVAIMNQQMAQHSLIGQVRTGVSLEFGIAHSQTEQAMSETISIIESLLSNVSQVPKQRHIYHISGTISPETRLPRNVQNFQKADGFDFYPFLVNEKSYTAHQGFMAYSYDIELI